MSARAVLYLLPGLLSDATVWRGQLEAFSGRYDIRVPSFYGFDSLEEMARSVIKRAPPRFAVAGHSMGARVALEILALAPQQVERIALLDTGAHPPAPGEAERRHALLDLVRAEGLTAASRVWLPPMLHPDRLTDRALMADLTAMVERATPEIFEGQVRALLNRPDGFTRLPLITMPCAMIVGRQDAWSPPAQHEAMKAHVSGAVLTIIEDAGHFAPIERPDIVNAALNLWLAD